MSQQAIKKSPSPSAGVAPIRIVVADDHPVVRFGVRNMLLNEPGFEVVGEAEDGDDAITQTLELEPDILLLDVLMPRLPGLEAMRAIMPTSPRVKIVPFGMIRPTRDAFAPGGVFITLATSCSASTGEITRVRLR